MSGFKKKFKSLKNIIKKKIPYKNLKEEYDSPRSKRRKPPKPPRRFDSYLIETDPRGQTGSGKIKTSYNRIKRLSKKKLRRKFK